MQYIAMYNILIFPLSRIVLYCKNKYCNISIYCNIVSSLVCVCVCVCVCVSLPPRLLITSGMIMYNELKEVLQLFTATTVHVYSEFY